MSRTTFTVTNPFDGTPVAEVAIPTEVEVEAALVAAHEGFKATRKLPAHVRADALAHVASRLAERADEAADLVVREGGKPVRWARGEVDRAVSTFRFAAEEARREGGEMQRLDTNPAAAGRLGLVRRFPYGPILGITPFNFPLNLVAHKLAPAIAVGAPIVVKPAPKAPLSALLLAELVAETDLPTEILSVLPLEPARTEPLVRDPRIAMVSFTGSGAVGWRLKAMDPRKRFALELGGNAAVVVHSDADLEVAAERIALGACYHAGQSCISAQRVLVQADVHEEFTRLLVEHVGGLRMGNPADPSVDVGPLIDRAALKRVAAWVDEALAAGADALIGGRRRDPFYEPTVLVGTTPGMKVRSEEIFGPVLSVTPYETFDDALAEVNASRFGLQAGVFTASLERAFRAHRELRVGGVVINDHSGFRADQMPYGGVKESGYGREGLRWAMQEMTEPRIMVLPVPL